MVKTQVEQVLKAQNGLLDEMNNKMNDHNYKKRHIRDILGQTSFFGMLMTLL